MQAVEQKEYRATIVRELNFETSDTVNCFQIKEKLDTLFSGDSRLEEMHAAIRRVLFRHLETCENCCRVFDARVGFRPARRDTIY